LFIFYTFAGLDNLFKASEDSSASVRELGMFGVSAASAAAETISHSLAPG
jgi:hypothetical protein